MSAVTRGMPSAPAKAVFYGPMLIVKDFAKSFEFYRSTLGLATEVDGSPPWAEFQSDGVRLVLLDHGFWTTVVGAEAGPRAGGSGASPSAAVLAIQVPDVDAKHAEMVKEGFVFVTPPTDHPMMGVRAAMVRDPDGTMVELSTQLKPKK